MGARKLTKHREGSPFFVGSILLLAGSVEKMRFLHCALGFFNGKGAFDDFRLSAVMANHREGSAIFRVCGLAKIWLAP